MIEFRHQPISEREPEFEITNGSNGKQGIETKGGLILYQPVFDSIVRLDVYISEEFEDYVYRLERNGKYGLIELEKYFIDVELKEYLPIEYDELKQVTYNRGLFVIARKGNMYGLYSRTFKWILSLEYDNMTVVYYKDDWSEFKGRCEYLLYQKGDKYGVVFIPHFSKTDAVFDEILPPIDEYGIRLKKDGVWGHLNKQRQFTPDLSQVPMEWEQLSDVHIDDTRTLHELNRGMKKIKSEIDIPEIDLGFG